MTNIDGLGNGVVVGLTQDPNDLLITVSRLLHLPLAIEEAIISSYLGSKKPGRVTSFSLNRLSLVSGFQRAQIAFDTFIYLLHPVIKLVRGEVLIAVSDGLELAVVNRNNGLRKQLKLAAHHDKLPTCISNANTVIMTKVGNVSTPVEN